MAKLIKIKPAMDGNEKIIYVDYPVISERKTEFFNFQNNLGSTELTTIRFYDLGAKSGPPESGICEEMSGGTVLELANTGNTQCTLAAGADPGYYAYTISNPEFTTLDPVLIIELEYAALAPGSVGVAPIIIAALVGGGAALFGRKLFSRKEPIS